MGADDGETDVVRSFLHERIVMTASPWTRRRSQRSAGGGVVAGPQGGESGLGARGADERNAEGQLIGPKARRHGQSAQIEEIDEVCVVAEVAIAPDGIAADLLDPVGRGARRYRQHRDLLEYGLGLSSEEREASFGAKDVGSGKAMRAKKDGPHDRIESRGIRREQGARCLQTLRQPRPLGEEACSLAEWGQRDFDELSAEGLENGDSRAESVLGERIAEELEVSRGGHAKLE